MQAFRRVFRLWEYRVSHDQLLLRSPKGNQGPRNVDVIWVGVEYIDLPSTIRELVIDESTSDDALQVQRVLGIRKDLRNIFVMLVDGRRHLVVAAAMRILENDLELFESSLERFA